MFFRSLNLLILLSLTLVIQGCGFQLRGALDISSDISPLYLQQNSVFELAREIKSLLATNKIALAENSTQANTQLVLLNETKQRRVLSVDGNGRAREYALTYTVNFTINIRKAENQSETMLVEPKPESISLTRTLVFEPDAVLAVTNETEILYNDMRRNAASSILLRLQARSRQQSVPVNKDVVASPNEK
jgi:LPS-assembly lipoprotein